MCCESAACEFDSTEQRPFTNSCVNLTHTIHQLNKVKRNSNIQILMVSIPFTVCVFFLFNRAPILNLEQNILFEKLSKQLCICIRTR